MSRPPEVPARGGRLQAREVHAYSDGRYSCVPTSAGGARGASVRGIYSHHGAVRRRQGGGGQPREVQQREVQPDSGAEPRKAHPRAESSAGSRSAVSASIGSRTPVASQTPRVATHPPRRAPRSIRVSRRRREKSSARA
ncbi:hypothetical protein FB451DRAFT_1186041 [Mycena latifolia]|nr:hypothetical protein FB451DRAFT_1186041 [Mycena latifolia]